VIINANLIDTSTFLNSSGEKIEPKVYRIPGVLDQSLAISPPLNSNIIINYKTSYNNAKKNCC